jgi:hypothetical protein
MIDQLRDTIGKMLGRKKAEHVLADELLYHLEQLTAEHQRKGMSHEEARRKAKSQLGGMDQIKEECRDNWGTARFEQVRRDFVHACRNLRRSPGYALLVVLTLALGAGSNTALFSLWKACYSVPCPSRRMTGWFCWNSTIRNGSAATSGFRYLRWRNCAHRPPASKASSSSTTCGSLCSDRPSRR